MSDITWEIFFLSRKKTFYVSAARCYNGSPGFCTGAPLPREARGKNVDTFLLLKCKTIYSAIRVFRNCLTPTSSSYFIWFQKEIVLKWQKKKKEKETSNVFFYFANFVCMSVENILYECRKKINNFSLLCFRIARFLV